MTTGYPPNRPYEDTMSGTLFLTDRPPNEVFYVGTPLVPDKPSDMQVGGDHYRKYPIQPTEYIVANGVGFLAGNVIKYVTRYKDKAGAEDIRKAIHYLNLILEFEYGETK